LQTQEDIITETKQHHENHYKRNETIDVSLKNIFECKIHKTQSPHQPLILDGTTGRKMEVDLSKKLVFPSFVQTNLRPDIVLWSEKGKKFIMIELTVPWETRCEEAYERKKTKYTELLNQCRHRLAFMAVFY
jgi:hypothetical protein